MCNADQLTCLGLCAVIFHGIEFTQDPVLSSTEPHKIAVKHPNSLIWALHSTTEKKRSLYGGEYKVQKIFNILWKIVPVFWKPVLR